MDGVVIDTEPVHHYAFVRHFEELRIPVSDEEYASFIGSSTRNVYQRLKAEYALPGAVEALMARKREFFNRAFDEKPTWTCCRACAT